MGVVCRVGESRFSSAENVKITDALQSEITVYIIQSTMNNKQNQNIQLRISKFAHQAGLTRQVRALGPVVTSPGRQMVLKAKDAFLVFNCNLDITVLGISHVKKSVSILNLKRAYTSRCSSRSGNVTLTNEVKLKRDLLSELMGSVVQTSPTGVERGGMPFGKYAEWLRLRDMPFDLLPSCSYMVRGESQKSEYIGKMGGKVVLGGLVGEGLNRKYNRGLMTTYKELYYVLEDAKY